MDAIIGRYKVCMEENGLVLKHPMGLSFDFQPDEVLELWKFIGVYRESLANMRHNAAPQPEAINTEPVVDHNNRWRNQ